jgi:hypothetical protein
MEEKLNVVKFKFPRDRENYLLKLLGYIILACIIVYVANRLSSNFAIIVLLVVLIVLSEKIYMFLNVDEVMLKNDDFIVLYKKNIKHKIPINNLGIKVTHDINGVKEVSFYNFLSKKKILSLKENEVDEASFIDFMYVLGKYYDDKELFDNGTYGEVVQLAGELQSNLNNMNYIVKKSFYSSYGWVIIPLVVMIIVITLILIK